MLMLLASSTQSQAQKHEDMNRFVVACALVACAYGAPMPETDVGIVGAVCYANAGAVVGAPVAHAPTVVGQTHHSYAAGLAVTKVQQVIASNNCVVAGQMTIPQPVTSHVAEAPQNLIETEALPAPVIPAPSAPYAAIPPAPVPARPAPAGTVVQTNIAAPFRTHTKNTTQVTNVVPKLNVQKYNVDVPVAVPRAVPRKTVQVNYVAKPYVVPVLRAVPASIFFPNSLHLDLILNSIPWCKTSLHHCNT